MSDLVRAMKGLMRLLHNAGLIGSDRMTFSGGNPGEGQYRATTWCPVHVYQERVISDLLIF